jgi:hypothetical protein
MLNINVNFTVRWLITVLSLFATCIMQFQRRLLFGAGKFSLIVFCYEFRIIRHRHRHLFCSVKQDFAKLLHFSYFVGANIFLQNKKEHEKIAHTTLQLRDCVY